MTGFVEAKPTVTTRCVSAAIALLAGLFALQVSLSLRYYDIRTVANLGIAAGDETQPEIGDATRGVMRLPVSQTWGKSSALAKHFADHGADFAARTADEYAEMASGFFQRGLQSGIPTKIDPKTGIIRMYDPTSNTFGAFNPTGTTRTFFKPDPASHPFATNWDYWLSQPGYSP